MNFTDRTSYLLWASEWKAAYARHSSATAQFKREFKQAQREQVWSQIRSLQHELTKARFEARRMIEERHESKCEAQRQFLAARLEKAA